jgi:hypothetical protein
MGPIQLLSRGMLWLHRRRPGLDRLLLAGALIAAMAAFLIGVTR